MANTIHEAKDQLNDPTKDNQGGPTPPQQEGEEHTFRTLPHPAKSNDPADLEKSKGGSGASGYSLNPFAPFTANPGPVIPDESMQQNLPPPRSREELRAEQTRLDNQK